VAATGWISMKFDVGVFYEICQEAPNFVTNEQKYLALRMKTEISFTVVGNINLP
jgi:hypothetical protein